MTKIIAVSAEGIPPDGFEDFVSVVVGRLLGYSPPTYDPEDPDRLQIIDRFRADYHHSHWPRDLAGLEYLHRGLARLLWERGGTAEAADGIRHDLEAGRIRAVVIDDDDGEEYAIPPQRWRAADGSRYLYYKGRADVTVPGGRRFSGDIYLIATADPEAAPEPANAKPTDLGARERTTAHKLILGLAAGGYGYRPTKAGERTKVISDIVGDLERLGLGVSDETIRKKLTDAYEAVGRPDLD
jgi:hypothetical protein